MPAPSQLAIATSSVTRLLKEEASYHKEQELQEARIERLEQTENDDQNAEFSMKQERRALEETKAVFPEIKKRIQDAAARLQQQLSEIEADASADEVAKAKEALEKSKAFA